ncbi:glutamine amidotransferase-related protein [Actinomyces gaoshouyii]|uniref:Glutamine amidotransferase n=1 Tax=Actinomyces gaoshouyii TaxID=1960083 RepID=A0A8H9H7U4_9ACTO|nr:hypothetical protein [Actinomyces gaoshouyii]ARD41061.1 hypothetical protein B6G06_00575 [Actinomyces gaoshouyii]GGO94710.1 glutamine amidotransferase [Actinomyces gaoshouyii]
MKPFIMVSTRPEISAAEDEYESFLSLGRIDRADLTHVLLEEVDFLGSFNAEDVSGVLIGGSPYNVSTPEASKSRSQLRIEEQVSELIAVALTKGVPVLATGFGLEVLAAHLGTATSAEFGQTLGTAEVFLTEEGRHDPLLEGMPPSFTVLVGHHEGAVGVPEHAVLLASSPDCPVQMLRVGSSVYGTQFNPELDADRFAQRISIYTDAGYGHPGQVDELLRVVRGGEHVAGRIIARFFEHFARD